MKFDLARTFHLPSKKAAALLTCLLIVPTILSRMKPHACEFYVFLAVLGLVAPILIARHCASVVKRSFEYDRDRRMQVWSAVGLYLVGLVCSCAGLGLITVSYPFSKQTVGVVLQLFLPGAFSYLAIPDWRAFARSLSKGSPFEMLCAAICLALNALILLMAVSNYLLVFYGRFSSLYTRM